MPYEVVARQGGSAPSRYDAIDLVATKQMQRAAKRGKDLRRKHRRGGTRKALNMANRILSGQDIHPDNVRDMFAFFERFSAEAQKQRGTEKWDTASDRVGPLRIAWDLWGGDSGRAWARRKRNQLDAADKRKRRHHHPLHRSAPVQTPCLASTGDAGSTQYSDRPSGRSARSGAVARAASFRSRSHGTTTALPGCSVALAPSLAASAMRNCARS